MLVQGAGGEGVYGSIYVEEGSAAQSVQTATVEIIDAFNTADGANGNANGVTPAKASNKITIDNAGEYMVACQCSFQGGANVSWEMHGYINGVKADQLCAHRKTPTNDVGSMSFVGSATIAAAQDVDIRISHSGGGDVDFTVIDAQLFVWRISGSG